MKDITVQLLTKPEFDIPALIGGLANLTQLKKEFNTTTHDKGLKILDALTNMGHTSLLECADFAFIISGASRVFLAQITRHRLASFTSQSQQYQDHTDFPYVVPTELLNHEVELLEYNKLMEETNTLYKKLFLLIGRDSARYVLPSAARNDLYMKVNLRELLTVIMPQRLCKRNTTETVFIVRAMITALRQAGFEDCLKFGGCACVTEGKCDQGKMSCKAPYASWDEMASK